MNKTYRIENPQEELRRNLHTTLGEQTHEYLNLPCKYAGPEPFFKPVTHKELPPTYLNYYVMNNENEILMNSITYEDGKIDVEFLEKNFIKSVNFSWPFSLVPNNVIITQLPLNECARSVEFSSIINHPIIKSFADYDSENHIKKIREKTNSEINK